MAAATSRGSAQREGSVTLELRGFLAERLASLGRRHGTRTLIDVPIEDGAAVGRLMASLAARESRFELLYDPSAARLPEHVEVVLNDRVLDLQGGLAARLQPGDVLTFLPAHAGGSQSGGEMVASIDLNCDLGESYGRWSLGEDAAMVRHITSANLACGFHAGDFGVMDATVGLCKAFGVGVGAQPGYPDLQGFGRRPMSMAPEEVEQCVLYQIGALYAFCRGHGVDLQHVKPHGALYNQAAADPKLAQAIARAVARFSRDVPLVGLAGSAAFQAAAADAGLTFVAEAFADRRYNPDGSLQSRSAAGSLLTDPEEAARQARQLVCDGSVVAHDGTRVPVRAQSLCFHGDTPGAARIVAAARAQIEAAGVRVRRMGA